MKCTDKNTFKFSVTPSEIAKELKKGNSVTTFVERERTNPCFEHVWKKAIEVTFIPDDRGNAEIQINNVFGGDKDDVFFWTWEHCKSWAIVLTGWRSSNQRTRISLLEFDGRIINSFLKGAVRQGL